MKDGRIVEVTEVVGVEGSRVLFERYRPPRDTVLKRYRVASILCIPIFAFLPRDSPLLYFLGSAAASLGSDCAMLLSSLVFQAFSVLSISLSQDRLRQLCSPSTNRSGRASPRATDDRRNTAASQY